MFEPESDIKIKKTSKNIILDVNEVKTKYPLKLDGDISKDNIIDLYPDLMIFKVVQDLVSSYGRDFASIILWGHIILLDPRRLLFDKMTFDERRKIISEEYFAIEWEEFLDVYKFVMEVLLANEDIISYIIQKELHEKYRRTQPDFAKTRKNAGILRELHNIALGIMEKTRRLVAGELQPGAKVWLVNNK